MRKDGKVQRAKKLSNNDAQHNNIQHKNTHRKGIIYDTQHNNMPIVVSVLFIVLQNVIMLSVIMLSVMLSVLLNVIMMNVIMLNVIMTLLQSLY
jgi:hypothetical protein